jgi:uncharacterized protein
MTGGGRSRTADKMRIDLRINVDRALTAAAVAELLDILADAGLHRRLFVHFGHVNPATNACRSIGEACLGAEEFAQVEVEYYRMLLDRGFLLDRIPLPQSVSCMAGMVNAFLVDPEGDLYRCYLYAGDKSKSIGNIRNPIDYQHPDYRRMFAFDPFDDPTCRECFLLPTCMGGCPARRAYQGMTGEQLCKDWKYNLQPMLEIAAETQIRTMQAAENAADKEISP